MGYIVCGFVKILESVRVISVSSGDVVCEHSYLCVEYMLRANKPCFWCIFTMQQIDLIARVLKLPFYQTCGIWPICIWYQHLDTLGYGNCKTGLNISSHMNTCNGLLVPRQNLLVQWNKIFEQAYFFFLPWQSDFQRTISQNPTSAWCALSLIWCTVRKLDKWRTKKHGKLKKTSHLQQMNSKWKSCPLEKSGRKSNKVLTQDLRDAFVPSVNPSSR